MFKMITYCEVFEQYLEKKISSGNSQLNSMLQVAVNVSIIENEIIDCLTFKFEMLIKAIAAKYAQAVCILHLAGQVPAAGFGFGFFGRFTTF